MADEQKEHWTKRLTRGLRHAGAAVTDQASGSTFHKEMIAREEALKDRQAKKAELKEAREFATSERIGTQAATAEQAELGRLHQAEMLGKSQAYDADESLKQRMYGTGERVATQEYATGERLGTQEFQSAEATESRDWQGERDALGRSHDLKMVEKHAAIQQLFQERGQAFEAGQSELTREQQIIMQEMSQKFAKSERVDGQAFSSGERVLQNIWTGGQADKNRALQELMAEEARAQQTAEREATQAYGTGERLGSQEHESGERAQDRSLAEQTRESNQAFQAEQNQLDREENEKARQEAKRKLNADNAFSNYETTGQALTKELEGLLANQNTINPQVLQQLADKEATLRKQITDNQDLSPDQKNTLISVLNTSSGYFRQAQNTAVLNTAFDGDNKGVAWSTLSADAQAGAAGHLGWNPYNKQGNEMVAQILALPPTNISSDPDQTQIIDAVKTLYETGVTSFEQLQAEAPALANQVQGLNIATAQTNLAKGQYIEGTLRAAQVGQAALIGSLPSEVTGMLGDWQGELEQFYSPGQNQANVVPDGKGGWTHTTASSPLAFQTIQGQKVLDEVKTMGEEEAWDLLSHAEVLDTTFPNQGISDALTRNLSDAMAVAAPGELDGMLAADLNKAIEQSTAVVKEYELAEGKARRGDFDLPLGDAEVSLILGEVEKKIGYSLSPQFKDKLLSFKTKDEQVEYLSYNSSFWAGVSMWEQGDESAGDYLSWQLIEGEDGSITRKYYNAIEGSDKVRMYGGGYTGSRAYPHGSGGRRKDVPIGVSTDSPKQLVDYMQDRFDNWDLPPFMIQMGDLRKSTQAEWNQEKQKLLLGQMLNDQKERHKEATEAGSPALAKIAQAGIDEIEMRIGLRKEGYHNKVLGIIQQSMLEGERDEFGASATLAIKSLMGVSTEASLPAGAERLTNLPDDASVLERFAAIRHVISANAASLGGKSDIKAGARADILMDSIDDFVVLYEQFAGSDPNNSLFELLNLTQENEQDKLVEALHHLLTY